MTSHELMITALLTEYQEAIKEKNLIRFLALYDQDITVYDMWNVWAYKGMDEWRGMVEGWFSSLGEEVDEVEFSDTVIVVSQEMATLYTMAKYRALSPEGVEMRSLHNRMSWVLRFQEDRWKVIHEHSSSPGNMKTGLLILEK